jgi:hypothetical protein
MQTQLGVLLRTRHRAYNLCDKSCLYFQPQDHTYNHDREAADYWGVYSDFSIVAEVNTDGTDDVS